MLFLLLLLGTVTGQSDRPIDIDIPDFSLIDKARCYSKAVLFACFKDELATTPPTVPLCGDTVPACPTDLTDVPILGQVSCATCLPKTVLGEMCRTVDIPECGVGAMPELDIQNVDLTRFTADICPTCNPAWVANTCTIDNLKACTTKMMTTDSRPPACTADEKPHIENCCLSCTPPISLCTDEQRHACVDTWRSKPRCNGTRPMIENCCRSCKTATPNNRPNKDAKCSQQQLRAALAKLEVCNGKELRITDREDLRCGPNCRRPEDGVRVHEVFKCLKDLAECPAGERPERLPDTRCPPCIRPRPSCDCPDGEVCVRKRTGNKEKMSTVAGVPETKCVAKSEFKVRFKVKMAQFAKKLKDATNKQMGRAILEFLERFCNRNSEADRCEKWLETVKESLKCKAKRQSEKRPTDFEVDLEVAGVPGDGTKQGDARRLLTSHEVEDFVNTAILDNSDDVEPAGTTGWESSSYKSTVSGFVVVFLSMIFLYQ